VPTKRKLPLIAAGTSILLATIGGESAARNLDGDLTYARSQGGQTVHRVPTNPDGAGDTAGWLTRALALNTSSAGGGLGNVLPRNAAVAPPAPPRSTGGASSPGGGGGAVFASSSGHASFNAGVPMPRPESAPTLPAPSALTPPAADDPPASDAPASDPPGDQQSADNGNNGSGGSNSGSGGTGASGGNPVPFADDQAPPNTTELADEVIEAPTPGIGSVALVTLPDLQADAINEPQGLMLLGVGLVGLSLWRLRRLA
jgi:hypothetical protein